MNKEIVGVGFGTSILVWQLTIRRMCPCVVDVELQFVAILVFLREPDRCSLHLAQRESSIEPLGCCRATWMDEDRADYRYCSPSPSATKVELLARANPRRVRNAE